MRGSPLERDHVSSCSVVESVLSGPRGGLREGLVGQPLGRPPVAAARTQGGLGQAGWGLLTRGGVPRYTSESSDQAELCSSKAIFYIYCWEKSL